jgi:hypothetical protein
LSAELAATCLEQYGLDRDIELAHHLALTSTLPIAGIALVGLPTPD